MIGDLVSVIAPVLICAGIGYAWARAGWAHPRVIAVERVAGKFEACRETGADEVVDASLGNVAEALAELTRGEGIDVAVDFVSSGATPAATCGRW